LYIKSDDSRFSHSGDMIAGIKTENGSCDRDHDPFKGDFNWFAIRMLV